MCCDSCTNKGHFKGRQGSSNMYIYCNVKKEDGADFNLDGRLFQKVLENRNNDFVK